MDNWEATLAQATAPDGGELLGAIGLVVNSKGKIIYNHAAGRQTLEADSPALDPLHSTVSMMSSGKIVCHIAALQLVECGLITLDEPVYKYIPELESLPIITRDDANSDEPFTMRPHVNKMTLRHLLTHTSGFGSRDVPILAEYSASKVQKLQIKDDAHYIVKGCLLPLLFEPGEGFQYGESIHFLQLLVEVVSGTKYTAYCQANIFDILGMKSSTYGPKDNPGIWERRLRMVEKKGDKLIGCDEGTYGITCSISDIAKLFADILSNASRLLKPGHIDMLFEAQLSPESTALQHLRSCNENYSFAAGKPETPPSVNWTAGGELLVEDEEMPLSKLPKGTVTWEGWGNVMLSMNRKRGLATYFATQLIPLGGKANELAVSFMRDAWKTFGEMEGTG